MIAVADASPLCYLVVIGEIDLLPKLFVQVAVPQAVMPNYCTKMLQRQFEPGPQTYQRGSAPSRLPSWQPQQRKNSTRGSKRLSSWPSP